VGSCTKTEKEEFGIKSLACIWPRQVESDNRVMLWCNNTEDKACL